MGSSSFISGYCNLFCCQHWFRLWLGATRQQGITWTNVDQWWGAGISSLDMQYLGTLQWHEDVTKFLHIVTQWKFVWNAQCRNHIVHLIFLLIYFYYILSFFLLNYDPLLYFIMAIDALAPCITRSSAATVLTVKDKWICILWGKMIHT